MAKASSYAFLDRGSLSAIQTQLLCEISLAMSNCPPSDFIWTPTTTDIYPQFAYHAENGFTGVDTLEYTAATMQGLEILNFSMVSAKFPNLTTCPLFDLETGPNLTTLELPVLASATNGFTLNGTKITTLDLPLLVDCKNGFAVQSNANLTAINVPLLEDANDIVDIEANAITVMNFPSLKLCAGQFAVAFNSNLTSLSIPQITGSVAQYFFSGNPLLTTITLPTVLNTVFVDATGSGLNQATVDAILHKLVLGGQANGTCSLDGGTNATPSAAGLADKATLVGNGWTVTNN